MICTIHQPNFVPWEAYFEKVRQADVFIVMSHCQFEKGGFQNRFNHGGRWYSMSVARGLTSIETKEFLYPQPDWERIKRTCPNGEILEVFDDLISPSLTATNTGIIERAMQILDIDTQISRDEPTNLRGSERLLKLCVDAGATTYLSGPSGRHYLDLGLFREAGISVEFFSSSGNRSLVEMLGQHVD